MKTVSVKTKYQQEVVPKLQAEFGYQNIMAVPRVLKVVVNVGTGKIFKETEKIEELAAMLKEITGQKPLRTKSKKAISGFKIREGLEIGMKVTLRGKRMWDFIDRLVNTALPRTRDFQGITLKTVDAHGNLNLGIKEHIIFPEVVLEKVKNIFGLQVTVTTNARSKEVGEVLFKTLGFPLQTKE